MLPLVSPILHPGNYKCSFHQLVTELVYKTKVLYFNIFSKIILFVTLQNKSSEISFQNRLIRELLNNYNPKDCLVLRLVDYEKTRVLLLQKYSRVNFLPVSRRFVLENDSLN